MPLEFRTEQKGHGGKSRSCMGVYADQRRVGEVLDLGSMIVFKSGAGSRSFPNISTARRWLEDTYKAHNQGPKPTPDTRPTASSIAPPRTSFPDHPDQIERTIYEMMRDAGSLIVTPPGTNLPPMTLDMVLRAGVAQLLGPDPANSGTVLQAKRTLINTIVRRMGHYLPADFDQTARRNKLLQNHVVAAKNRMAADPPALAQALFRAIEKKPELAAPESASESQPYHDYPDDEPFDVADLFEQAEKAAESPPESAPAPIPAEVIEELAVLATSPLPTQKRPKGRGATGNIPKFNARETQQIRAKCWHGTPEKDLAAEYNTSLPTIYRIVEGTYVPREEK
jgi:hypothetical protein